MEHEGAKAPRFRPSPSARAARRTRCAVPAVSRGRLELRCEMCGAPVIASHCKRICLRCGFMTGCSEGIWRHDQRDNDAPGRITFAEEDAAGRPHQGGGRGRRRRQRHLSRMIASGLQGIEFIAVNTDLQALRGNRAPVKIQIGGKLTKGLGAGANPDVGRQAAVEDTEKICDALEGSDMVFITTGLGGGTGTGAAPVVASIAGQLGGDSGNVLTVAVVTLPFALEGKRRMGQALDGLAQLRECVDSVIAIPNDRLLQTVARNTPVSEAFRVADDVLRQAVQGISDIIIVPGLINLDFADVRAVMKGMGQAVMGTGIGEGENRATEAAQRAISQPAARGHARSRARGASS